MKTCTDCRGTGIKPPASGFEDEVCIRNGNVDSGFSMTFNAGDEIEECPACKGIGHIKEADHG